MRRSSIFSVAAILLFSCLPLLAQAPSEQVQVEPPPQRHGAPPDDSATLAELEARGDQLRAEKAYLDALDYYESAIRKSPNNAKLYNKSGITKLLMQRMKDASKDFEKAIRYDKTFADAHNNLGVIYYETKKYPRAIKEYERAIKLRPDAASYFSNLGAAYFARNDIEKAVVAYNQALQLDPDVLEHNSRAGVTAQLPSPEDRAHYDYVMAKLYAKMGVPERSLQHLRRAMEEGYKKIEDVYKDPEFATLRADPRFDALMKGRPEAITQ
ncbi:MAG TPA: tetratricopeptide repeat protein [Terriglobales bacterium]|nr:tetratricopeptide repeat protein [Terriglobales bacterium]